MSRLIDADEMLKRLESWNTDDEMDKALYNFTLNRIIEQPTVDAIPIEYINKIMEEVNNLCDVDEAPKYFAILVLEALILGWRVEQEKQND